MPKACNLCGLPAFVLLNGSSLALFVERKGFFISFNEKIITSDIDADSIVEMIYRDSENEG